ncbi:MAG: hypothetical protein H8D23_36795 [Candidatus Brocadiales bacterium]|nr:hypothetical protein [Candidatus Brocadiales bacterium]
MSMKKLLESIDSIAEEQITESEDSASELQNIQEQMMDLCRHALDLVGPDSRDRARSYWYGHIMGMLGSEEYTERSYTMQDSIDELMEQNPTGDEEFFKNAYEDYARARNRGESGTIAWDKIAWDKMVDEWGGDTPQERDAFEKEMNRYLDS